MNTLIDFCPEAVILGGGDYPTHPLPLKWLHSTKHIVCCDGAATNLLAKNLKPWRIVGDGDSLSPQLQEEYKDILRRNPDQETNDQTKAVQYLKEKGFCRIAIMGATGKREDHTLGNISLLLDYMRMGIETRIYTDHGAFIPCCNNQTFYCPQGSAVSIFAFGTEQLQSEGLQYPIYDFKSWWQGTLNRTLSPQFTLRAKGDYIVFINYPAAP